MKERLDLKNAGMRLFDEIQKINLKESIEEAVLFGDVGSLFPEYKVEHIRNTMRVDLTWLGVYAFSIIMLVVTSISIFSIPLMQDFAIWFALAGMLVITYGLSKRIMYMDPESLSNVVTRRTGYVIFGLSILLTASVAVGAVVATFVFFTTLIFSAG